MAVERCSPRGMSLLGTIFLYRGQDFGRLSPLREWPVADGLSYHKSWPVFVQYGRCQGQDSPPGSRTLITFPLHLQERVHKAMVVAGSQTPVAISLREGPTAIKRQA